MVETLVLLHGANGSCEEMRAIAERLPASILSFAPNWLGHGGRAPPGEDYAIETIVDDLEALLDRRGIERCFLFGYSIGGYLAMVLAHRRPDRVRGVATLAARAVWHRRAVDHIVHLADPARLTRPGNPRPAELAATHHPADWRLVNAGNRRLFATLADEPALTAEDVRGLTMPGLILNGADDPLVPAAESHALAGCFRTWRLGLFPGKAHPLGATPLDDIAAAITAFVGDVAAAGDQA